MDLASLTGVISGITLILSSIFLFQDSTGAYSIQMTQILQFWNLPGVMIVFGGTIAATFLNFPLSDVRNAFRSAYFVFREEKEDPNKVVATMIQICNISRKQGILELSKIETKSGFLKKACNLIADGTEEEMIRASLRTEIDSMKMRHFIVQDVFKKMGAYSPSFGMIGTLIGLVKMLGNLSDPATVGPAMAVALLTTFYGSLLSSMFFLPIAGKLKSRTILEIINLEIMFEGSIAVLESNNPLIVYEKLSSFIPTVSRKPLSDLIGK